MIRLEPLKCVAFFCQQEPDRIPELLQAQTVEDVAIVMGLCGDDRLEGSFKKLVDKYAETKPL